MSTDDAALHIDSGAALLRKLALDLRWWWNHATDALWSELEPDLWALTHNPWVILRTVSRRRLDEMLTNPEFRGTLDRLAGVTREAAPAPPWFQRTYPESALARVAYFSM